MAEVPAKIDLGDGVLLQVLTDDAGPALVADRDLSGGLEMVRRAIERVGSEMAETLAKVAPSKASVELGFNLTIEAGQLVAMLVGKGSGSASIKVTLEWSRDGDRNA
jgi:hypothetical protein